MRAPRPIKVAAVGDLMLGDSAICVGFGFRSRHPGASAIGAFAGIAPLLRDAEVVIGNLECPLTASGVGATPLRADQMRGDPEFARVLRDAGFTALSVANNHAVQHGTTGFSETVQALRSAGISVLGIRGVDGWCAEPVIHRTTDGQSIGMLAYCWRPRQYGTGDPPFAEGSIDAVCADVRRLRADTDAVIVALHWGEEFLPVPSEEEVAQAHSIIDAGASLLLGHHPHVVRPVQRHADGVIAYSLGNCLTDMVWQEQLRRGVLLSCELAGGAVASVDVRELRVDDAYCARPVEQRSAASIVTALAADEYARSVSRSVREQQMAAYRYAARNVLRYRPNVLVEMVATTASNKLRAAGASLRRRAGVGGMR